MQGPSAVLRGRLLFGTLLLDGPLGSKSSAAREQCRSRTRPDNSLQPEPPREVSCLFLSLPRTPYLYDICWPRTSRLGLPYQIRLMSYQVASGWSPRTALPPCIAISAASAYSLYILSVPRHYRLESVALVFVLAAGFEKSFDDLYPDDRMNAAFAHGILMWLVHMVHVTLIRGNTDSLAGNSTHSGGRELPEGGWTSVSAPGLGTYHRAYKMLYNFRGIGTSWQVVKTPQQGPSGEAANKKQSRNRFLLRQLFTIFCRYFALAAFYEASESGVLGWPTGGSLLDKIPLPWSPMLTAT